jgi:asparagine synthase (glutamine-hydrolysing)
LGQRRLHTTPESLYEQQPLVRAQGSRILVADSRLDNRDELAEALGIAPAERATLPDSALLLAAYEKWGDRCPEHLLGDFAFALWDQTTCTLLCARDHLWVNRHNAAVCSDYSHA